MGSFSLPCGVHGSQVSQLEINITDTTCSVTLWLVDGLIKQVDKKRFN